MKSKTTKNPTKRDPEIYKREDEAIQKAIEAYNIDKNQKIKPLARQFDVKYTTLRNRIAGCASRSTRPPTGRILSNDQEASLFIWIGHLDDIGCPPTAKMIEGCANSILKRMNPNGDPAPAVGSTWVYRFIKRLPKEYKRIKQQPIDPKRLTAESLGVIQTWYDRLKIQFNTYQITPSNLWNMDETGFRVGQGKQEAVVTAYAKTSAKIASASSRESLTIIETVNAAGNVIPPLLILAGKSHLEQWYQNLQDEDYQIGFSPNGYTTDELAFEWIHDFELSTREYAGRGYRMLLMDNFGLSLRTTLLNFAMPKKSS